MSWPAVAWALGQKAPSSASKFVLVMLADAASAGDWLAWPSAAYLSDATQQDRKTVLANLKKLELHNLIKLAGKTGKTGQVAVWRLPVVIPGKVGNDPKNGMLDEGETVPFFPSNSTVFPPKRSQKRDTEPVRNQKEPESGRAKRSPPSDRGSRLAADWTLPEEWKTWAEGIRQDLDLQDCAERFKDYWLGLPGAKGRKADWLATWRNWVKNERAAAGKRGAPSSNGNAWEDAL